MSEPPDASQKAEGGGAAKRLRCLYCGASNFPTTVLCWQCGRPLMPLPTASEANPRLSEIPLFSTPPPPVRSPVQDAADPKLAVKAAATLGLMFPFLAVPVGLVFLMLDDPRKIRLGWITIGWSLAGTVASTLVFLATLAPILAVLKAFLPSTGHGGGLPTVPLPGGDSGDLNFLFPLFLCLPVQLGRFLNI